MNDARRNLIDDLVADLKPVAHPGRIGLAAALWLVAAVVYTITIVLSAGPVRPGALGDLLAYPLFALETLVAAGTIVALAIATLALAVPGRSSPRRLLAWPLVLGMLWVSFYVVGLVEPAHPVSMAGKRDHCFLQALLFSLPNLFALLAIARRFYPVWPRTTAATAGLAAGAIPAALMQFSCMYVPSHILLEHLTPVLIAGSIGALVGPLVLTPRRAVPRSRGVSMH